MSCPDSKSVADNLRLSSEAFGSLALPRRYRDYFRDIRITHGNFTWELRWECRMCGQIIKKNTAGAQSHLAKHVREGRDASFHIAEAGE